MNTSAQQKQQTAEWKGRVLVNHLPDKRQRVEDKRSFKSFAVFLFRVRVCMPQCTCGGERTTCRNVFSPPPCGSWDWTQMLLCCAHLASLTVPWLWKAVKAYQVLCVSSEAVLRPGHLVYDAVWFSYHDPSLNSSDRFCQYFIMVLHFSDMLLNLVYTDYFNCIQSL